MYDETTEAPIIEHTRATTEGGIIRLRAASKRTQRDGWAPDSVTVEFTGPVGMTPANLFHDGTLDLYAEIAAACATMNDREGR